MDFGIVKRASKAALAATLVVGLGVTGIGSVGAQDENATVRITHASPDAPAVDIWVNGEPAVTDLAFGSSTDLISLPGGSYDVAVTPAGSTDPEADAVIAATLDLVGGEGYDVVATGNLANIGAQVYPIDLTALDEGTSRIQFVHASPDAPAVDILVNGGAAVEGLEFPNASGFLEVPAGTYDVQVAVSETGDVAIDAPGVALEAGTVYTVMAIGEVGNGTLAPIILTAPAAAVGGEAAAASTDTAVTTAPATGIGSTASSSAMFGLMLAAALILFAGAGAFRFLPAMNRSR